jgi:hypothetical protein
MNFALLDPILTSFADNLQSVENECLQSLKNFRIDCLNEDGSFSYIVRTPKPYFYDNTMHTQIQEYLPNGIDLKTYMLESLASPTPESLQPYCHQLGKSLAIYITGFFQEAKSKPELHTQLKTNIDMQALKHMINYDWMIQRIDQFPEILSDSKEVLTRVKEEALSELESTEKLTCIHGDFWPGK